MRPKSETLFHFTKSIDVLKNILLVGIEPRYCLEDVRWLREDLQFNGYAMSCFCDIPLSRIDEHTAFYGRYGIGFNKAWGLKNALNPVIYTSGDGMIVDVIDYLVAFDNDDDNHIKQCVNLIKHVKPLSGDMIVGGTATTKDFYQENEWRYVPNTGKVLPQDNFEKLREELNNEAKEFKLDIAPTDINYILVDNDSDIPSLVDFINNELGVYPLNDLKILQTRITSIETINRDM